MKLLRSPCVSPTNVNGSAYPVYSAVEDTSPRIASPPAREPFRASAAVPDPVVARTMTDEEAHPSLEFAEYVGAQHVEHPHFYHLTASHAQYQALVPSDATDDGSVRATLELLGRHGVAASSQDTGCEKQRQSPTRHPVSSGNETLNLSDSESKRRRRRVSRPGALPANRDDGKRRTVTSMEDHGAWVGGASTIQEGSNCQCDCNVDPPQIDCLEAELTGRMDDLVGLNTSTTLLSTC